MGGSLMIFHLPSFLKAQKARNPILAVTHKLLTLRARSLSESSVLSHFKPEGHREDFRGSGSRSPKAQRMRSRC